MAITRRELFRFGLGKAVEELVVREAPGPSVPEIVWLRPPGALDEDAFLTACTRCDDCIPVCPEKAIRRAGEELSSAVAGTPVIVPVEQPCWMCRDLPCIAACKTGALRQLEAPEQARMGGVNIRLDACYSAQGSICDVCAERCPIRPEAVNVSFGQAPVLDPELCTGCGVCVWLCPADAIDALPR